MQKTEAWCKLATGNEAGHGQKKLRIWQPLPSTILLRNSLLYSATKDSSDQPLKAIVGVLCVDPNGCRMYTNSKR